MEGYVLLLQRGRRGQPSRDVAAAAAWAACNALIRGYQVEKGRPGIGGPTPAVREEHRAARRETPVVARGS